MLYSEKKFLYKTVKCCYYFFEEKDAEIIDKNSMILFEKNFASYIYLSINGYILGNKYSMIKEYQ